ncbi:M42 family metallopeptidase [Candidatus Woesearchaeota archaeon]|nr:M42 family metallopeptidase [Candidatus Woesearchaeota archaeon]
MTKEILVKLINTLGPSGNEDNVRNLILKEIKPYVDTINVDKMGNLVARIKGKGKKAMLTAHMDEIGLMINKIDNKGRMSISVLGGIEPITLAGQTVSILTKKNNIACKGVITFNELHESLEIKNIPAIENLYIDAGIDKKELLKKGVEIGSYVVTSHWACDLGSSKVISGKALDDRVGCYVLIQVIKNLKKYIKKLNVDAYFVFTVQEEVGLYGAKTSVYEVNPDFGLAIDATNSADSDINSAIVMGNGPSLTVKDSEIISNRELNEHIKKLAKKYKIPLELEVVDVGTTDATSIMFSKGGVPSTVISIPVRNLHSNVGMIHFDDLCNAIGIILKLLKEPPKFS